MSSEPNNQWTCPVCETINTEDRCIVCGSDKSTLNKIEEESYASEWEKKTDPQNGGSDDSLNWLLAILLILLFVIVLFIMSNISMMKSATDPLIEAGIGLRDYTDCLLGLSNAA